MQRMANGIPQKSRYMGRLRLAQPNIAFGWWNLFPSAICGPDRSRRPVFLAISFVAGSPIPDAGEFLVFPSNATLAGTLNLSP